MEYHWYNTEPDPRRDDVGVDCGQTGWRLHAVLSENDDPKRSQPAACGLIPAHGWGLHMFIEKRCKKCERALSRMTPNAKVTGAPPNGRPAKERKHEHARTANEARWRSVRVD